jgi:hypothetical protein
MQVFLCLICGTAIKIIFMIGPDVLQMYISQPVVLSFTNSSLFYIKIFEEIIGMVFRNFKFVVELLWGYWFAVNCD